MTRTELLVVGAGPGGLCAAIEASRAGVDVTVVDDNLQPGGQIFRQLPPPFQIKEPKALGTDFRRGKELLAEALSSNIHFRFGCTAWGLFDPNVMEVVSGSERDRIRADRIVLATGAYDRPVPVPGWTLPGVFTIGGAQSLLKSQRILVGRRVIMAGLGPLLLVVTGQLHKAGVEIVAVAEPVSFHRVIPYLPALLREWSITRDGLRYRWSLAKDRVPWLARSMLVRVEGDQHVERGVIAKVDRDWRPIEGTERSFEVDAVCIGYGLLPSVELPRICGCELRFAPEIRSWLPLRDPNMETTVAGVFVVGDCAGIAGAVVAAEEGRIAGITVARQLNRLTDEEAERRITLHRVRCQQLKRFRRAFDRAYVLRRGLYELATPETIICRCEEVVLRELQESFDDGARSANNLKAWSRAGMGPCQGRMCSAFTTEWLARTCNCTIEEVGLTTPRLPAKPIVPLRSLAGN